MKYIYILFFIFLYSCTVDSEDNSQSYTIVFYPRQCKTLATGMTKLIPEEYEGVTYYEEEDLDSNDTCTAEYLGLILSTSNLDTLPEGADYNTYADFYEFHEKLSTEDQQLDDSYSFLEEQMEDDYRNRVKSTTKSASLDAADIKSWEYRTTGISSFSLTCNKTLFNQSAGTSLNDYIYLYEIERSQIISYETQSLVFGYSDDLDEMSVSEWLSLKPMAQPTIYFRFKSIPEELTKGVLDSLEFTFNVETTEGLSLSVTTLPVTLTE